MPVNSTAQARDEMLARLRAAIAASAYSATKILYEDAPGDRPTGQATPPAVPPGLPWLRVSVQHVGGSQASLGDLSGKRRQVKNGFVSVQVFTPAGDGMRQMDPLVDVVLDAYRTGGSTPGGVHFREARFSEIGKDGAWFQANCLIDFEYDVIR